MIELPPLDPTVLSCGIRSRFVERINGLRVHILEAGEQGNPLLLLLLLLLLLRGFSEIAYSWRKIIPALAGAGSSHRCPRSARLWSHDRAERQLRRRPRAVPPVECGA